MENTRIFNNNKTLHVYFVALSLATEENSGVQILDAETMEEGCPLHTDFAEECLPLFSTAK